MSLVIFGVIALVVVAVVWKWWKKPTNNSKKTDDNDIIVVAPPISEEITDPQKPPPMVFAVNDDGNLDLSDINGKILNMSYGPNPKVYINLLDQAEKDVTKLDVNERIQFISNVGNTKLYQVGERPYIINYTRLA